jgi:hypothetical protein
MTNVVFDREGGGGEGEGGEKMGVSPLVLLKRPVISHTSDKECVTCLLM